MMVQTDGFRFNFTDAVAAFVFDEKDRSKPTFHGVPMKAVDIVAEFAENYVWVEIKDHSDLSAYDERLADAQNARERARQGYSFLKDYLKYKYRDTYLFRHAEQKVDKPIHYICLLSFDNALNGRLQKDLRHELPVGQASPRWQFALAKSCQVLNLSLWNKLFPKWPAERISAAISVPESQE